MLFSVTSIKITFPQLICSYQEYKRRMKYLLNLFVYHHYLLKFLNSNCSLPCK